MKTIVILLKNDAVLMKIIMVFTETVFISAGKILSLARTLPFSTKQVVFAIRNYFFQQDFLLALLQEVMNGADGVGAVTAPVRIEVPFKIPHRILLGFRRFHAIQ